MEVIKIKISKRGRFKAREREIKGRSSDDV
jgi:hypothetical protein